MIQIQKAALTPQIRQQLIALSEQWVKEDCSFGMRANTAEDLREPCFVALDGSQVVGYGFGHFYTRETANSYIPVGASCFDVDELYVLPAYRSQGIGRQLFARLEQEAAAGADYITLATSTKDYERVLSFYTRQADMVFHSAFLIKKTHPDR